jgi:hypothetical protein
MLSNYNYKVPAVFWLLKIFSFDVLKLMEKSFPTKICSDGRHFIDTQEMPFFRLGDTAWSLFTNCRPEDAEAYLKDRAKKGFTVIQCVLTWFRNIETGAQQISANWQGEYPWLDGNPAQPNPRYFDYVERLFRFAGELGLTLAILPTWGNIVTDLHLVTIENAKVYGVWLGQRFKNCPNLVWINAGDCLPHGFEDVFDALGEGLREGDQGAHLITFHPCSLHSSALYFNGRSWLDFHMIQVWTDWDKVYESIVTDSLTPPRRPVVLGEGAYENGPEYPRDPITPLVIRRQAWWAFMAGGYYTYGQDQIWRAGPHWLETLDLPGTVQMGLFRQIVCSFPWWERIPDQAMIETGLGEGETLNTAIRSMDGRWAMLYLSSRCYIRVRLEKLSTPRARATCVNPAKGEQCDAGIYVTYTMPGFRQVRTTLYLWIATSEHWEDVVFILEGLD